MPPNHNLGKCNLFKVLTSLVLVYNSARQLNLEEFLNHFSQNFEIRRSTYKKDIGYSGYFRRSLKAANFAASFAQESNAELHLIHVYEPEPPYHLSKKYLEETMNKLQEKLSSVIPEPVRASVPGDVILEKGHPVHNAIALSFVYSAKNFFLRYRKVW